MSARSRRDAARVRLMRATHAATEQEAVAKTLDALRANVIRRGPLEDDEAMRLVEAETKRMRQEKRGRVFNEQG